jgi:hypothetical protein
MTKRLLGLRELELVIMASDITVSGNLRANYKAHIGRKAFKGSQVITIACGDEGEHRWTYSAHPFFMVNMRLCQDCWNVAMEELLSKEKKRLLDVCNPHALIGG